MSTITQVPKRDRWARLRFMIIGALLADPPGAGQLQEAFRALASKTWRHPITDLPLRFGVSSLQRWYYAARRAPDPVAALRQRLRADVGAFPSLSPTLIALLQAQYRSHPGWSMQLHLDNVRAALASTEEVLPSYPTLRRFLKARGMVRQRALPRNSPGALAAREHLQAFEVRSFEVDHVGALWHLDFHHGSRKVLSAAGTWVKPILFGAMDDRSRLACHLQWYLDESAQTLVHGLTQAFMKRALPRALMTDNGAAMLAEETTTGLACLGVVHRTTLPYSAYQNAKQESFWGRVEGRLMAMLEGEATLTLDLLNAATQAWVEQEYHRTVHSEIHATPLARFLAGPNVHRPCPDSATLANAFRIEIARRVRRSDATVSLAGQRFEIPARYRHFGEVHLRYARWDLSRVDLIDARTGTILCAVYPLDKSANADAQRRRLDPAALDLRPVAPTGMAPLLRQLLADYAATGLPPAYLPSQDRTAGESDSAAPAGCATPPTTPTTPTTSTQEYPR